MKSYNGVLSINNEEVYNQAQYKVHRSEYLAGLEEEFYNGYSDLEIINYTASIYKLAVLCFSVVFDRYR